MAFAGVFDGHDGSAASQYCSDGLLQHILQAIYLQHHHSSQRHVMSRRGLLSHSDSHEDTDTKTDTTDKDTQSALSHNLPTTLLPDNPSVLLISRAIQSGFEQAQDEFGMDSFPPTFQQVGTRMTKRRSNRLLRRVLNAAPGPKAGGTTACTLCLVRTGRLLLIWTCAW
jgi:serine/threonine protein phosphatase PrpC